MPRDVTHHRSRSSDFHFGVTIPVGGIAGAISQSLSAMMLLSSWAVARTGRDMAGAFCRSKRRVGMTTPAAAEQAAIAAEQGRDAGQIRSAGS
jgi:hypothetical protein